MIKNNYKKGSECMTIDGELLYYVLRIVYKGSLINEPEDFKKVCELFVELRNMKNKGINIKSMKFNVTNFNQL